MRTAPEWIYHFTNTWSASVVTVGVPAIKLIQEETLKSVQNKIRAELETCHGCNGCDACNARKNTIVDIQVMINKL